MAKKNNNLWYILGGIVIAVLVIWIILANVNKGIVCNAPYIQVGNSCCLDENSNGVCDSDEKINQEVALEEKTKVSIFDWKGTIQQSSKSKVLKQREGYHENLYRGGEIELKIIASSPIDYRIVSGRDCIAFGDDYVLKTGTTQEISIRIDTSISMGLGLCIEIINPLFMDWDNINPVTVNVEIFEYQ